MKKITALLLLLVTLIPHICFAAGMYCPYCGTKVDASYSFCPSCGKSLKNVSTGTQSVNSRYIPGFLHDFNELSQIFTSLINEGKRNVGAKGKWVYSEQTFPLKFAFDLRQETCLENHLDKSWMFTEKDAVAGDEYINHSWYYAPKSMQYMNYNDNFYGNKTRLYYTHTDYIKSKNNKKWGISISFVIEKKYIDIEVLKTQSNLTMEIKLEDYTLNTSSMKYYFTYVFDGSGSVLLDSTKWVDDSNGRGLI